MRPRLPYSTPDSRPLFPTVFRSGACPPLVIELLRFPIVTRGSRKANATEWPCALSYPGYGMRRWSVQGLADLLPSRIEPDSSDYRPRCGGAVLPPDCAEG